MLKTNPIDCVCVRRQSFLGEKRPKLREVWLIWLA